MMSHILSIVTFLPVLGVILILVTRGDKDWLTTLLTERKVRLHIYQCSTREHRIAEVNGGGRVYRRGGGRVPHRGGDGRTGVAGSGGGGVSAGRG